MPLCLYSLLLLSDLVGSNDNTRIQRWPWTDCCSHQVKYRLNIPPCPKSNLPTPLWPAPPHSFDGHFTRTMKHVQWKVKRRGQEDWQTVSVREERGGTENVSVVRLFVQCGGYRFRGSSPWAHFPTGSESLCHDPVFVVSFSVSSCSAHLPFSRVR